MSTNLLGKSFGRSKSDTADALNKFVQQGTEQEKNLMNTSQRRKVQMLISLPVALHTDFKDKCQENGVTMSEKIRQLIKDWIEEGR